jgi:hypothetical protein
MEERKRPHPSPPPHCLSLPPLTPPPTKAEGLVPEGSVVLHQYHPPFTYGWQRVNEVLFRVKE